MSKPQNTYTARQEWIAEVISLLNQSLLAGAIPDATFIADLINAQDDQQVRAWLKKHSDITQKEFDRALRNSRIITALGAVPTHAANLVDIVVAKDQMNCLYNGQITRNTKPFVEGSFVTPEEMTNPMIADKVYFACPRKVNLDAFMRQLRMTCDEHKLGMTREAINDAVTEWVDVTRRGRREYLYHTLSGPLQNQDHREKAEATWLKLAETLFVTSEECPADFVVAVLKKFIHQVMRKLRGLAVYDHLMPVILGTQGKGKSTFVRAMLEPIRELVLAVDFKMIEDDRNIDIWASYVLFIDEMGFASKANIDTIKNSITAETLTRKPLYTNSKVEIDQNATFIGCSNKKLEQLIKDPTGIRRFVALMFSNDPDWGFLNQIDWTPLWQSVDQNGLDPMTGHKERLTEAQEASREMGRVEHWLTDFDPETTPSFKTHWDQHGRVKASLLYSLFREFEDGCYPGSLKTSLTEWGNEMRRTEESGQNTRFTWLGKVGCNVLYRFIR